MDYSNKLCRNLTGNGNYLTTYYTLSTGVNNLFGTIQRETEIHKVKIKTSLFILLEVPDCLFPQWIISHPDYL